MNRKRIFGIIAILTILVSTASAFVQLKTDKSIYSSGENITFYLYNNGYRAETVDVSPCNFLQIKYLNTGKPLDIRGDYVICAAEIVEIIIQPNESIVVGEWKQQIYESGQPNMAYKGFYQGYYNGRSSNIFVINDPDVDPIIPLIWQQQVVDEQ